jgi:hypothetical protein
MNFRERINDETLSLRKSRHKQDLFSRRSFLMNDRSRHLICPLKLKGIPEQILEKFRINDNNLDETIKKTYAYLNSTELDEIKFGAFLLRLYFVKMVTLEDEFTKKNIKFEYYIDAFIENGIIPLVGKVLNTETNIDILCELSWSLVNFTNFKTKKNEYEYLKDFLSPVYMEVYYKLINIGDNELTTNLYNFLVNCIIEDEEFAKRLFFEEKFVKLCIMKYLEPTKSIKVQQEAKKAATFFFVSLSRLSNFLNEKQKNTFYKIYEKLLSFKQFEPDVLMHAIVGLRYLFWLDESKEKSVYNFIKRDNYEIFDKFFFTLYDIMNRDEQFKDIDQFVLNISFFVQKFISIGEEQEVIFLLQKTQLLNFIEAFYSKIFYKSIKCCLVEILVMISHHTSNVIFNMVNGHDALLHNLIKTILLNEKSFEIRSRAIEIVYYMLSVNSIDINVALFRNGIIGHLVTVSLVDEVEPTCLKNILNGILCFINSLKSLENQWKVEIINNLITIGITNGLENNNTKFNDEHNVIISQIKEDIKNILNCQDDNNNNNNNGKNLNNLNMLNINNENKNNCNIENGNGFLINNENCQNGNPFLFK